MLDKHEVAKILKVSYGTINNMMKEGRLPYIKVGKLVRFREDAIERIISGEVNTSVGWVHQGSSQDEDVEMV